MDPQQVAVHIPPEFYAVIGTLIATNIGAIGAAFRYIVKKHVEFALIQHQLTQNTTALGEVKADLRKLEKDLNNAYAKIREAQASP